MKKKTMTRAQAEALAASTTDPEVLNQLMKHPNKHVVAKVTFKLKRLNSTLASGAM